MRLIVAATAVLLLLSGCAVTSSRPAGLSEDERGVFLNELQEREWQNSGVTDRERPVVDVIEMDFADIAQHLYDCLDRAGLADDFVVADGGLAGSVTLETSDEQTAFFVCRMSFMASPRYWGYLSADELNATYDYYQDWLLPCLEEHNYHVPGAPARAEVASRPGYLDWSPYIELRSRIPDAAEADLLDDCPEVPPWMYE